MPEELQGRRRVWVIALLLALLIHLGVGLAVREGQWTMAVAAAPEEPPPVEMTFAPRREPDRFLEQPETREETPERADFLSNVDSRSSSPDPRTADDDLPSSHGAADAPDVRLVQGRPESPAQPAPPRPVEETTPAVPEENPDSSDDDVLAERSLLGALVRRAPLPRPEAPAVESGNFDISQEAMERALNGAQVRDDEILLSTYEWAWKDWIQPFRRGVLEHWNPPSAYFMGLIHGWAVIRLEVARDGRILSAETMAEEVGHRSLTSAAHLALNGAAPYRPLPDDFPDETLVLEIRFTYPDVRRAPAPQGAPR
jgi:hypothetical protein